MEQAKAIAFTRSLLVPLSQMPQEVQQALDGIFRPLHTTCTRCCGSNTYFRYFDNYKTALRLQPRYRCRDCKRCFTAGGKPQEGVPVGGRRRNKKEMEEPKPKKKRKSEDEPSQRLSQAKRRCKVHGELNTTNALYMPSCFIQEEQHAYHDLDCGLCDTLLKMLEVKSNNTATEESPNHEQLNIANPLSTPCGLIQDQQHAPHSYQDADCGLYHIMLKMLADEKSGSAPHQDERDPWSVCTNIIDEEIMQLLHHHDDGQMLDDVIVEQVHPILLRYVLTTLIFKCLSSREHAITAS